MNELYSVRMSRAPINLLLQSNASVIRIVRGVTEVATGKDDLVRRIGIDVDVLDGDRWCRIRTVVGKGGMLRPDTGVDDTDHDALASDTRVPGPTAIGQAQEVR